MPLPAASWLLDSAMHQAEQARIVLQQAGIGDWQGNAAVAYRQAVSGLVVASTALREQVGEAARSARVHEQDLQAIQAQYGDAR